MFVKIHNSHGKNLLAVCDENLLGRELLEGDVCFLVDEHFYQGETKDEKEVLELLLKFTNFNIVGREVVDIALKHKLISEEDVIYLEGVPHAAVSTC